MNYTLQTVPTMTDLIYLTPSQLRIHPENMRRYYPPEQVAEMAASIQATGGLLQAMLVVPDPERPSGYLVVDGNMRLAGAHKLGDACPPLKCEPITADRAAQMLIMATTTALHYPKDPISEALHYRRLLNEGYSVNEISQHTGIAWTVIRSRLRWLELDTEIQEHVAAGRLPRDGRVAEALQSITDSEARLKLADRLAAHGATIQAIVRSCAKLVESLQVQALARATHTPSLAHSGTAFNQGRTTWQSVRAAARQACSACDLREQNLAGVTEPAWEAITHAAGDTCSACNLRELQTLCSQCPVVELLRRLNETVPAAHGGNVLPLKVAVRGVSDGRAGR